MILVKNKWFPFGNYKAINICGVVFYEERGIKIGAGTVEIKIPFINKAIALDKDDINEFKEMLSKIQQ